MRRLSDADSVEAFRCMCSFSGEGGVERSTRLRRNSLDEKLALGTDDEDTSNARTVYLITFARLLSETANTTKLRDPSTSRRTYNTEGTSPSDAVTAERTSSGHVFLRSHLRLVSQRINQATRSGLEASPKAAHVEHLLGRAALKTRAVLPKPPASVTQGSPRGAPSDRLPPVTHR